VTLSQLKTVTGALYRIHRSLTNQLSVISGGWRHSIVVRTLVSAGELSLFCARLLAGWVTLAVKPSAIGQLTWPTQSSIPQGSVNE